MAEADVIRRLRSSVQLSLQSDWLAAGRDLNHFRVFPSHRPRCLWGPPVSSAVGVLGVLSVGVKGTEREPDL